MNVINDHSCIFFSDLSFRYGSPNVFNQFAPHVSLAWSTDTEAIADAVKALNVSTTVFAGEIVAMGSVGPHGTVLKGKDLARFNITDRGDVGCRHTHLTEAPCDADNVTDGGCVWCDIVDHPAFCTTTIDARQIPPPPQGPPSHCNWKI